MFIAIACGCHIIKIIEKLPLDTTYMYRCSYSRNMLMEKLENDWSQQLIHLLTFFVWIKILNLFDKNGVNDYIVIEVIAKLGNTLTSDN